MLRAGISLIIIGLVAFILGANNIAGVTIELGRTILYLFLFLAIISFVINVLSGKKTNL
jgi:uncharacterized membrane protein YtjA (UPF0391 family)